MLVRLVRLGVLVLGAEPRQYQQVRANLIFVDEFPRFCRVIYLGVACRAHRARRGCGACCRRDEIIGDLLSRAAASPRKRMNFNLHAELTDPISRFLNAGIAGTYVRPLCHRSGKWELVSLLRGRCDLVIFTSDGLLESRVPLSSEGTSVAEIPGGECVIRRKAA